MNPPPWRQTLAQQVPWYHSAPQLRPPTAGSSSQGASWPTPYVNPSGVPATGYQYAEASPQIPMHAAAVGGLAGGFRPLAPAQPQACAPGGAYGQSWETGLPYYVFPTTPHPYYVPGASSQNSNGIPYPQPLNPPAAPPLHNSAPPSPASDRNQSPGDDRPHACPDCAQRFKRKHDLKRHRFVHQKGKRFACELCNCKFARKDALRRHSAARRCQSRGMKLLLAREEEDTPHKQS